MTALLAAFVAAVGFSGTGLLALLGRGVGPRGRSYAVALAAGILLALAFADLFPEALEEGGVVAVWGFVGGFAALSLAESLLGAHTHHAPKEEAVHEHVREHALAPFLLGLAVHNLADGFVLGVGTGEGTSGSVGLVGLGVLVHQIPVGVSLAAVLVAAGASRRRSVAAAVALGLAIPLAADLTAGLPVESGGEASAALTGAAAGVLVYVGTSHLLPETRAEGTGRATGLVFAATLVLTVAALLTVLGD